MVKLFEGFKILCTDFDHILEKKWGKLFKEGGIFFEEILSGKPGVGWHALRDFQSPHKDN